MRTQRYLTFWFVFQTILLAIIPTYSFAAVSSTRADPVADYTYTPDPPVKGQTVTFDASPSTSPNGSITNYAWDLDGNGTDDKWGKVVTWTYTQATTYHVKLWIQDSTGKTDVEWKYITVVEPTGDPVANYTYTPNPPVKGQTVTFDGSLSTSPNGSITNYAWDFDGNGTDDDWG
ncbi:MAG: PKD domain-containing protein, partial [Planctomycetota bacterium]